MTIEARDVISLGSKKIWVSPWTVVPEKTVLYDAPARLFDLRQVYTSRIVVGPNDSIVINRFDNGYILGITDMLRLPHGNERIVVTADEIAERSSEVYPSTKFLRGTQLRVR